MLPHCRCLPKSVLGVGDCVPDHDVHVTHISKAFNWKGQYKIICDRQDIPFDHLFRATCQGRDHAWFPIPPSESAGTPIFHGLVGSSPGVRAASSSRLLPTPLWHLVVNSKRLADCLSDDRGFGGAAVMGCCCEKVIRVFVQSKGLASSEFRVSAHSDTYLAS